MGYKNPNHRRAIVNKYHLDHRSEILARQKTSYKTKKTKINEIVSIAKSGKCLDCKLKFPPYVMEFDHVRGVKLFNIGSCLQFKVEQVIEEIAKCDVVCANCHKVRTYNRKEVYSRKDGSRYARDKKARLIVPVKSSGSFAESWGKLKD